MRGQGSGFKRSKVRVVFLVLLLLVVPKQQNISLVSGKWNLVNLFCHPFP